MNVASETFRRAPAEPSKLVSVRVHVAFVVLATAALALIRLGAKPLWHDEAFSEAVARLDPSTMWSVISQGEAFNGLYYAFMHPWVRVADGEAWLRLPSVAFGILAAYGLFALNRRLFGLRIATIGGVLLAVNSFFVIYEQEARPYALSAFAVVVTTSLFVAAVDAPSLWRWLVYGAVGALAIYVHLFAALVLVAHLASLPLRRRRPRAAYLLTAYGLTAVAVAPLLLQVLSSGHLQRQFIGRPTLRSFGELFLNLTGAASAPPGEGRLLLLMYFLACAGGVLAAAWSVGRGRRAGSEEELWRWGLVLSWLTVPVVGSFVLSLSLTPLFLPRYLIVAVPPLVTIAAAGIAALPRTWLRVSALAVLVGLAVPPLLSYYLADFKNGENWRAAVAYLAHDAQAGDGVVFLSRYGRRPFEYYWRTVDVEGVTPLYPGVQWDRYTPVLADRDIESTERAALRLERGYARIWVVLLWAGFGSVHEDAGPLKAAIDRTYQGVSERWFGPLLRVRLYVQSPQAI